MKQPYGALIHEDQRSTPEKQNIFPHTVWQFSNQPIKEDPRRPLREVHLALARYGRLTQAKESSLSPILFLSQSQQSGVEKFTATSKNGLPPQCRLGSFIWGTSIPFIPSLLSYGLLD